MNYLKNLALIPILFILFLVLIGAQSASALTFDAPVVLGGVQTYPLFPSLASDRQGHCVIAWLTAGTSNTLNIMSSNSPDHGATWSAPLPITSGTPDSFTVNASPQIGADGQGAWIAVWPDPTIKCARSLDNGVHWTAPHDLLSTPTQGKNPQIVANGHGVWVAAWQLAAGVACAMSSDQGVTWGAPVTLVSNSADAIYTITHESPSLATDGQGRWIACWTRIKAVRNPRVDVPDSLTQTYCSISSDEGRTWDAPRLTSTWGDQYREYNARIISLKTGQWLILRNSESWLQIAWAYWPTLELSRSVDDGQHWSKSESISLGKWMIEIIPVPQLAGDGAGTLVAVWDTMNPLVSGDWGATWQVLTGPTLGLTPQIAWSGQGRWLAVWTDQQQLLISLGHPDVPVELSSFSVE